MVRVVIMRRGIFVALATICSCALAPVGATAIAPTVSATAASTYRASLTRTACTTGSLASQRSLAARVSIYGAAHVSRMAVRFHLRETLAGGREQTKYAAGLEVWKFQNAAPTTHWEASKSIAGLAAPAGYRLNVDVRWFGSRGNLISQRTLAPVSCTQPDLRPDLKITGVAIVKPAPAGKVRYEVTVANVGKGRSAATTVQTIVSGTRWIASVGPISAGHSLPVKLDVPVSPAPAGRTDQIEVDPANRLGESRSDNNIWEVFCPAPAD